MKAIDNPFSILKATPRDSKARIVELVDEIALHGDQEAASGARSALTNTRSRLTAEIAWFPGLDPARVAAGLETIGRDQLPSLDDLSTICRANFIAESLRVHAQLGVESLRTAIEQLARDVDGFDPDEVLGAVNRDRHAAGIPAVSERLQVEEELASRCRYYQGTVTELLDGLPSDVMVETFGRLIAESSRGGTAEAPRLVNDLIDGYELHAGGYLKGEAARIGEMIDAATTEVDRNIPGYNLRAQVLRIIEALRGWDRVAQPIQISRKSRGRDHGESSALAFRVRELAIYLFNKHDRLEDSKLLSNALAELFVEVTAVSDKVQEDVGALANIERTRKEGVLKAEKDKEEFARAITYETSFGLVFKDKFRISPDGFDYKGNLTPLDKVTGVSWGSVKHYTNGIPTGTTHHFKYCTASGSIELTPNEAQFKSIISRAWRAVCIRILMRMMESWKAGRAISIGSVEIKDDGIMLSKSRLFRAGERKFHAWGDMTKAAAAGKLCFYGKPDRKFKAEFSYKDTLNVHIFDFAIGKIWEGKTRKLSGIFGDAK